MTTPPIAVAVAPNFHLPDAPAGHVLVPDAAGWRPACEGECSAIVQGSDPFLLFSLPEHLRTSFWEILQQDQAAGGFDSFASEVGRFLAFKQLPPPDRALFQLVLHGSGGKVEPLGLWGVINLGEDPVVVGVPGVRLRLGPGEGIRLPAETVAEVIPPEGDAPNILLMVRWPVHDGEL
jgi:hypothetical protein